MTNWPPFRSDNASTRHLPTDTSVAFKKSTPPSITGDWPFKQISDVDHQEHLGIMSLIVDGEKVSGMMTTWDGTKSKVDGTFVKDRLSLTRKTEMDTLQVIDMKMINPKLFSGSYRNEGQVQDSGTVEMQLNTTQR